MKSQMLYFLFLQFGKSRLAAQKLTDASAESSSESESEEEEEGSVIERDVVLRPQLSKVSSKLTKSKSTVENLILNAQS